LIPEVCQAPNIDVRFSHDESEDFVLLAVMNDYGLDDCLRPEDPGPQRWNAARKNLAGLLEAFLREFPAGGRPATRLVVKSTRPGLTEDITAFVATFCSGIDTCPVALAGRIAVEDRWFENIGEFLRLGHCLVAPSRGEGWCRPLAEALRAGMPVIGSSFGGQTDYLSDATGYVLRAQLERCPYTLGRNWQGIALWGSICTTDLRQTMRHVVTSYEEALVKAEKGRRLMELRCSPTSVAAAIGDCLIRPLVRCRQKGVTGIA